MSKQTINIGASPNDGTGTPLRTSFDYTNQNFTELYTALGGGVGLPGATTQVIFNDGGTNLAGDAGLVYNKTTDALTVAGLVTAGSATFTGAVVCNGAVTLGDAVGDAITVTGSLTAYTGQNPSAIRAAASEYAAVAFDGTTASTRIASTITTNPITTGDYTIWSRFRVPTTSIAGQDPLWTLGSAADGSGAYGITARYFTASNSFNIAIRSSVGGSSGGDSATADVTIPLATYTGQVVDLVVVRVASVLTVYLNGTSLAVTYAGTQASFALAPGNFPTNPAQLFGVGASTTVPFRGSIYRSVVFNRALSAGDVTELITTGVNPADQWGGQTGQTSGTLVASKRYRITTYVSADSFTNVGAASNATGVEFVSTGTTPTTWTNASTLHRIGGLVDLDFTVGTGYQATDRSTNALHGTLFNGVEFTQPKRVAVLYATTSTNGNQQMLGTLAIPTNAVIEDIIVNSTGTVTVSVGNASAGTQIVNAASVVSGRQKLTLATPFSTTGNLWVNANSTATLQFTIVYTIAS
jgi:hypothetical protein